MRKKTCANCGIVPFDHKCPVVAKDRYKVNKDRVDNKIYQTKEWRKLREDMREDAKYMCLVSFYCIGNVVVSNTVHHIIEVLQDNTLVYDKDNLIALSEDIHREIHRLYKVSPKVKREVQELQRRCKELWSEGNREIACLSGEWDSIVKRIV